jgi:hypothetical protein
MESVENPTLKETVQKDTELKTWLVNYVGNKLNPQDGNITVEMIVEVIAKEFPEFLMVVAEENFIRGYEQAALDFETANQKGKKLNKRNKK